MLDHVTATLPWDPRDLGSRTENILLDPMDPGSGLSKLSWDPADLRSYTTIISLYFDIIYIQRNFASGSPYLCTA